MPKAYGCFPVREQQERRGRGPVNVAGPRPRIHHPPWDGTQCGQCPRAFRTVLKKTDINPDDWTPREMRHSFVSLLSDSGMPLENISRLVGHGTTIVTETVYRKQLRAV